MTTPQNTQKVSFTWLLFFQLTFLEAAAAFLILLHIPSEGGVLGFSAARWAMLLPLIVTMATALIFARITRHKPEPVRRWLEPTSHPRLERILTAMFPLFAAATGIGTFLLRWYEPDRLLSYFERAWPLLAFVFLFSIQAWLWLLVLRFGLRKVEFVARKPALIAFALLLLVFGLVAITRLGVTPDKAYWGEPGVPLQGWQLGLALLLGALSLIFSLSPFFKRHPRLVDFLLPLALWTLAAVIWLSVPYSVLKNSFYSPIDPPANIPFPYSDSGYYDYMAHSLLIGTDYTGQVPTRPLYIVFLTVLHLLFGQRYDLMIVGQTLVLALLPVVFYWLGKKIHSRTAGVTIALLAIFREWTNLLVSSKTRVSNTKSFLVDMPTLLLILLACLFAFRWLERRDKLSAFIAGGSFGILLLLRTQSMLILPVLFVVAFLALRSKKRPWFVPLLVFTLGVTFSVTPWLTHNYLRIGHFSFDAPFEYQVLASQYAYTGNLDYGSVNMEGKSLGTILLTFALADPGFVIGFIVNHFLATEVGALLALPLIAPFAGLQAPIDLYWTSFNGTLAWYNVLLLIVYLGIIATGLGAAWRRWRWVGLLPLAFNLGYALANGIGRFSGWRYDLPADWIAYFYFGLGFAEILIVFATGFGANIFGRDRTENPEIFGQERHGVVSKFMSLAVAFALVGAVPWIAESLNPPPRYPDLTPTAIQQQMMQPQVRELGVSAEEVQSFAAQPEAVSLIGRVLYPRYFSRDTGLVSATPWPSYAPRNFPRLGFLLLNQGVDNVVLPIRNPSIPNIQSEDALLIGCQRENYIEARLAIFPNAGQVYLSDLGLSPCKP